MPVKRSSVSKPKLLSFVALAIFGSGCGNAVYAVRASAAASRLEEARELGAEQYALYEYTYAREHLEKAQSEAADADYGPAIDLAKTAEEYAERAVQTSRTAQRGAAR